MAQVNIVVNGRNYSVGCGDGEEDHVRSLAEYLDSRVREIAGSVGQVGEARLFLLAGLMVADDMAETMDLLDAVRADLAAAKAAEARVGEVRLDELTRRLEDIAGRLENA
ncbi:MAG TPA: cell division protein ZapA [Candidatus Sulfotelmatobacter sp.]|nr:cell division protein ZapA [Candidatus Sulfotelmatobacter sp.]